MDKKRTGSEPDRCPTCGGMGKGGMRLITLTLPSGKPVALNADRFVACVQDYPNDSRSVVCMATGWEVPDEWNVREPMAEVVRKLKEI